MKSIFISLSSRSTPSAMPSPTRFLRSSSGSLLLQSQPPLPPPPPPLTPISVDSDVVVVLAALLCALICVVGLALVARCTWLRRSPSAASSGAGGSVSSSSGATPSLPKPPNKGLKKKALRSLPKVRFDALTAPAAAGKLTDCAICLAEFAAGEEIRILPQCGHGFHVACIDTWLGSHSSCPSCRRILVIPAPSRCQKCGASSTPAVASGAGSSSATGEAGEAKAAAADAGESSYLP